MPGSPFNRIKLWKNIRGFAHKCFFQHYRCSVKKGESRGELGFSALEKYRRESRFCLWHNMTEVFEWSVGSWVLSRSFFSPSPIPSTPRSPSASFSNSFLFFERHYTSVLTFSRCRVRTGIDLCPPQMKTRGGPFSPFEWVILYGEVPCSIVVIPRFCQYYIELFIFRTLKRGWRES